MLSNRVAFFATMLRRNPDRRKERCVLTTERRTWTNVSMLAESWDQFVTRGSSFQCKRAFCRMLAVTALFALSQEYSSSSYTESGAPPANHWRTSAVWGVGGCLVAQGAQGLGRPVVFGCNKADLCNQRLLFQQLTFFGEFVLGRSSNILCRIVQALR